MQKLYKCEVCGECFNNEIAALRCEERHKAEYERGFILETCEICKQKDEHLPLCPKHKLRPCEGCPNARLVRDECDTWWRCKLGKNDECKYEV